MATPVRAEYLKIEDAIYGQRTDESWAAILLYNAASGKTIIRALDDGGSISFQAADGSPLALDVSVDFSNVQNTPTTLSGYGISDAYTQAQVNSALAGKADIGHTHSWADVSKTGSSLADLTTRSAADLSSGTLLDARVAASNVIQHQGALTIGASQLTGTLDDARVAASNVTQHQAALTIGANQLSGAVGVVNGGTGLSALGAALEVLRVNAAGNALEYVAAPTNSFASIANATGTVQFSASGEDVLRLAVGSDLGIAFDAATKKVTISYTGGGSGGITSAWSTMAVGGSSVTASGADTFTFAAAGTGFSAALDAGAKTITYTLNASALSIASSQLTGTLADARVAESNVTQHQGALTIGGSQLTGTVNTAQISGSYTGITGVGTLTAGTWQATPIGAVYGGTSQSSWAAGDMLYASAANTLAKRTIGTTGQVLTVVGGLPTWAAAAAGGALAVNQYHPGSQAIYSTSSTSFVDVDATNLTITFTAPSSGAVLIRLTALCGGTGNLYWNLRDGTGNVANTDGFVTASATSTRCAHAIRVTGLTPGASYTYKWGFSVSSGTGNLLYGGTRGNLIMEAFAA